MLQPHMQENVSLKKKKKSEPLSNKITLAQDAFNNLIHKVKGV